MGALSFALRKLTLTTTGTSGAATLSGAGVLNIPQYSSGGGGSLSDAYSIVSPTAPPTTGWSWVNQGTASVAVVSGAIAMNIPDNSSLNWRVYKRGSLSGSYTIEAHMLYINQGSNSQTCDLFLHEASSGKLAALELLSQNGGGFTIEARHMNSATSDNAVLATVPINVYRVDVLSARIVEDGTHRTFYYSLDRGINWKQLYQENTGTFLTPTEAGFGGLSIVANSTKYVDVSLLSWSGA